MPSSSKSFLLLWKTMLLVKCTWKVFHTTIRFYHNGICHKKNGKLNGIKQQTVWNMWNPNVGKPFKVFNPCFFMLLTTSVMKIPVLVHISNSDVCDIRWLHPGSLVDIIPSASLQMPGCWLERATGQNFCLKCQRQESARDQSMPRVTCAHKNTL